MTKKSIDYNDVLSDLRIKRQELTEEVKKLDEAIHSIERLATKKPSGNFDYKVTNGNSNRELPKGVYEGTAWLLEKNGNTMKNNVIYEALVENGIVKIDTPITNVLTTLYKAVKEKSECKIKRVSPGEWGLSSWN